MTSHILSCIDGSGITQSVSDASIWAAQRLESPVLLMHVLEKAITPARDDLSGSIGLGSREHLLDELSELDAQRNTLALEHGRQLLEQTRAYVDSQLDVPCEIKQRHDSLLNTILEHEQQTRLLVMGRGGNTHSNHGIGSHVESVARATHRPILMTVGNFIPPSQFMIAYDGSATSDKAMERVAASPLLKDLPCHMVCVNETPQIANNFARACALMSEQGYKVAEHRLYGTVCEQLLEFQKAHQIELLIMGAYGHSRIRQFIVGSNTARMIAASQSSLLLLR